MSRLPFGLDGRRCLPLLLGLGLLALPAAAQEDHVLMERDRARMNPAENPLEISGLDNGPQGFRSASPALLASDLSVSRLDRSEAYRRRLAMYESGATFSESLPPVDERGRRVPLPRPEACLAEPEGAPAQESSLLLPVVGVVLLSGLWVLRRSPGA